METIAGNLQILVDQKAAIKTALENKGKEPTDKIDTYAGLIDELDNEEQVSYVLTNSDGSKKIFAQLSDKAPVKLTATPNDIRENTTAITNEGVTNGEKFIPSYHTEQGFVKIKAGEEFIIPFFSEQYDYTKIQAVIALFNTKSSDSVAVDRVVIDDSVYNTGSTEVIANIEKDPETQSIKLGIINNSDVDYMIKYFTYREEI